MLFGAKCVHVQRKQHNKIDIFPREGLERGEPNTDVIGVNEAETEDLVVLGILRDSRRDFIDIGVAIFRNESNVR